MTTDGSTVWTKVRCPKCGDKIPEPFLWPRQGRHATAVTHRRGDARGCRVIVDMSSTGHLEALRVPTTGTYESMLERFAQPSDSD